ncbi:MAG: hypothetical protein Q7S76_02365 [bacterium]|nr:hypothetical protein [bacterium]
MRHIFFVGVASLLVTLASLFQTWVYLLQTPAGTVYPLVHNYIPDFYWYLSLMRQGYEGKLLLTSYYSSIEFPPQFVNTFFALAGMLTRFLGVSLPVMYTILRIAGGAFLLWLVYVLAWQVRHSKQFSWGVWIVTILGSPWFRVKDGTIVQIGEFWTGFDPILRLSFLPHHLFASAFVLIALIFLSRALSRNSFRLFLFAGVIAALGILLNPAVVGVLAGACGAIGVFHLRILIKANWRFIFFLLILSVPILWLWHVSQTVFPWTAFRDWEAMIHYPIDAWILFQTLGIVGIIALVSIPLVLRQGSFLLTALTGWFAAPFILLAVSPYLPVSNGRFIQSALYIPASLLAVFGISVWRERYKAYSRFMLVGFIALLLVSGGTSWYASIVRQRQYIDENRNNTQVYIPGDVIEIIAVLRKNSQEHSWVRAPEGLSTMIPAFTGHRVYLGHPTLSFDDRAERRLPDFVVIPKSDAFSDPGYRNMYENASYGLYQKIREVP